MTSATIKKPKSTSLDSLKIKDLVEYKGKLGIIHNIINYDKNSKYLNILDIGGAINRYHVKNVDEIFRRRKTVDILAQFDKACLSTIKNINWQGGQLGSDPEMFVLDSKTGLVIPSFKFLDKKGGKDKTNDGQSLFWDGFQAEFNISPGSCLDERVRSMQSGLSALYNKAIAYNPDAILTVQTTVDIPDHLMADAKPEHIAFGCMPSLNTYGMEGLKADGKDVPFRSAGGHIHLGLDKKLWDDIPNYVKALDKILGVACVSLFAKYDNPARRTLYGLAGEYRKPPHGLEYRVLSNAWACHPTIMYIVYELARKTIGMEQKGFMKYWDASEKETIDCINNCDVEKARAILRRNDKVFYDLILSLAYNDSKKANVIYNSFMLGMEKLVDPETIKENWLINDDFSYSRFQIANLQNLDTFDSLSASRINF